MNDAFFREGPGPLGRNLLLATRLGVAVVGKWECGAAYLGWLGLPAPADYRTQDAPLGKKLLLLTRNGTACVGCWSIGFRGWLPLPRLTAAMKSRQAGS